MTDKQTFVPVSAGEQAARVVHLVRIGRFTPKRDKFNKGSTPRLWITYEILHEKNEQGKNKWMTFRPFGEFINSYFTERGKQADLLEVYGQPSNTEENLANSLAAPVWLDVVHRDYNGKTYANVDNVDKVRKRDLDEFPDLDNEPIYFDVYKPDEAAYKALPFWIRNHIKEADDYEDFKAPLVKWEQDLDEEYRASQSDDGGNKGDKPESSGADQSPSLNDEDVPF